MWRLVVKRLAFAIPMLLIVSFFSFILVSLSKTDPATAALGSFATSEQIDAKRIELGLDKPIFVQYLRWVGRAIHGDFGVAILGSGSVNSQMTKLLPATISLVLLASLFATVLGVGLGVLSAVRGGVFGRLVSSLSVFGLAVPGFWIALVFTSLFAVKWRLFPVSGFVYFTDRPWDWLRSLILPATAVSLGGATTLAKQTRSAMLDAFSMDFVRVLQANGFSRRSIVYRHALRNAAIPVVTIIGVISVSLLGTAVLVENIFGLPGIGSKAVESAANHDLPIIQGAVVYFTMIVIAVGVLVDLAYALLDPRVRAR
jgi:peptide/nickel transport system permease protein